MLKRRPGGIQAPHGWARESSSQAVPSPPTMGAMDTHVLTGNRCLEIRLRRGSVVRCHEGVLWLTFEPNRRDVISTDRMLVAGQACAATDPGRLYVTRGCMTPRAEFEVEHAQRPHWFARLCARWAGRPTTAPQAAARAP